jgi:TatD DNase family protein
VEFFDSHAHLNLPEFGPDRAEALARARAAGVTRILNVGIDAESSRVARDLARAETGLLASAALHPNHAADLGEPEWEKVAALLREGGFAAVGETGLDYYREHAPPDVQRDLFRRHLELAAELSLPVVVHCRNAHADCRALLSSEMPRLGLADRLVLHCFSGTEEDARAYLALGALLSFTGVLTFPNAQAARAVAAGVPLARTLAETDCPWLAPQAHRGKRNEPAYVTHVVAALGSLHGVPEAEAARITTGNATCFFEPGGSR